MGRDAQDNNNNNKIVTHKWVLNDFRERKLYGNNNNILLLSERIKGEREESFENEYNSQGTLQAIHLVTALSAVSKYTDTKGKLNCAK